MITLPKELVITCVEGLEKAIEELVYEKKCTDSEERWEEVKARIDYFEKAKLQIEASIRSAQVEEEFEREIEILGKWKAFALGQVLSDYEGDSDALFDNLQKASNADEIAARLEEHDASVWLAFEDFPLLQIAGIIVSLSQDAQEVANYNPDEAAS